MRVCKATWHHLKLLMCRIDEDMFADICWLCLFPVQASIFILPSFNCRLDFVQVMCDKTDDVFN